MLFERDSSYQSTSKIYFIFHYQAFMKKISSYVLYCFFICLWVIVDNQVKAQEKVASNGKFATVNGLTLYYEEAGKRMPLIYLHAFTRSASDWKSLCNLQSIIGLLPSICLVMAALNILILPAYILLRKQRVYPGPFKPFRDRFSLCDGIELWSNDHTTYG